MAPIRLRHPKGVSTLQLDLENSTVLELQQQIFSVTEIPPSQQDLKAGYPPHPLTLIPELPLSSLGLKAGDQLTLIQKASAPSAPATFQSTSAAVSSLGSQAAAMTGMTASQARSPEPPASKGRSTGPDVVPMEGGYLVHRIVPDDNSCLFSSVALVFEQDISKAPKMRQIVADAIRSDPVTWNDAILGRPREDYISTILKPTSWGGAIELTILATHYSTEIASIDVETGRIDHFTPPPERNSGNRCVLIYSGIHYDAASLSPMEDAPVEFHQTIMPVTVEGDSDPVLAAAKKLADILRAKKAYTNTATFDLRCQICNKGLKGEKEARAHASETGHVQFGEY
ncbi:OTU-domain-containing protein [Laetiporus sulphureus 93-53]|uniref:Ubiquitin thioesterase OTU n=1 Tax=Laetiporus sulphureus 93-53 TaxID=1314785 RepID=A0A165H6T8_9APHY|nr:OTU-domain-containing protein [Laetiporus sulphureus 93-53]KZT11322.1 OTU-domain-containing protein [Laetiporus sulphureus 93-53]